MGNHSEGKGAGEQKVLRAVGYARTSMVLRQDPELQHVAIETYAKAHGLKIIKRFTDQITGSATRRPALDSLIAGVKRKEFDVVIIAALDRLGRSSSHLISLIPILRDHQVGLISLRESLDLETAGGRAFFGILSVLAQLDKEIISERIRSALQSKKIIAQETNSGWRCGRPTRVRPEHYAQILAMRANGLSVRAIAKQLGLGKTSVDRLLRGKR